MFKFKRVLSLFLSIVLVLSNVSFVYADEVQEMNVEQFVDVPNLMDVKSQYVQVSTRGAVNYSSRNVYVYDYPNTDITFTATFEVRSSSWVLRDYETFTFTLTTDSNGYAQLPTDIKETSYGGSNTYICSEITAKVNSKTIGQGTYDSIIRAYLWGELKYDLSISTNLSGTMYSISGDNSYSGNISGTSTTLTIPGGTYNLSLSKSGYATASTGTFNLDDDINKSLNLSANTYTATFNSNGGSTSNRTQNYTY